VTAAEVRGYQPVVISDSVLVRRVLEGDSRAFTTLVDRHAGVCLRYAARMLGNREDAEEATQETLLRAFRALSRYDESTAFRTWVMSILVNRCRSLMLYRHRREERVIADSELVARSGAEVVEQTPPLSEEIERALGAIDADQREAFLLKHVEEMSYDEMAAVTGASVSALKMRVKRACDRLRLLLEANDG
jgi:RNA polymerase sigma-70 factor (ECF subfamily)